MQYVPLQAQPSQTLQIVLNGQQCGIALYSKTGYAYSDDPVESFQNPNTNLYFDLTVAGEPITSCAICLYSKRLLINRQYLGFVGDFAFIDTQGTNDPQWEGLGTRYQLLYLAPADLVGLPS